MKATRSSWVLLAGLGLAGVASANPPRVGGAEAYVNGVEGTEFSTTTKIKGDVLFHLSDTLGSAGAGESEIWDSALRYAGEFGGFRIAASGGVGYHENPTEAPNGGEETMFYRGGLTFSGGLENGPLKAFYGLGLGATFYDEDLIREADENWVYDVTAAIGFTYDINPSWRLDNYSRADFGGHASTARGYFRGGVLPENVLDYLSDTKLHGRADGQALGEKGLEWSSTMTWGGFAAEDSDDLDSWRLRLIQEFRYNFDADTTVFVEGAWGLREWDDWGAVDSDHFRVGGGVRGQRGGVSGELKAGYHSRNYDDVPWGSEDRDVPYVEGSLSTQCAGGAVSLALYGLYGLQDLFPGEGGEGFVDPEGFRGGFRGVYRYNETVSFTTDWTYSYLDGNCFPTAFSGDTVTRLGCGLGCELELNDRFAIGATGTLIGADYDSRGNDTFFTGGVYGRYGF